MTFTTFFYLQRPMTTKNFRKILEVDSEEKVNKRSGQTSMLGTIWGKNSPFDTMGSITFFWSSLRYEGPQLLKKTPTQVFKKSGKFVKDLLLQNTLKAFKLKHITRLSPLTTACFPQPGLHSSPWPTKIDHLRFTAWSNAPEHSHQLPISSKTVFFFFSNIALVTLLVKWHL